MSLKRLRSEVGNLDDDGEPLFQSPLFKESIARYFYISYK